MVEMVMLTCALSCYGIFDQELERFGQLMSTGKNQDKLCKIYLHLYQAIRADEFSKELAEKMMPQLRKQQDLGKKIWGNKENPQFSFEFHILQDQMQSSAKTLENLTNSGKDLYLDVFRRFKSFPFFQNIANWFYPFSALHKEAQRILKGKQASFVQYFVENSPFCDSDKWSMFFLLQSSHANVILPEGFEKSAMPMSKVTWDSVCYDYIHDLYRFYFCSAHSIGCPNPFKLHVDPFTFPTLFKGLDDTHKLVMAEILMNNGGHQSAIEIINAQPVIDFKCHKMLAHCYQHQKDLGQAALHYECCLVEKDDIKIKKRLVSCYEKSAATKQKAVDLLLNLAEQDNKNELKYLFRCATCLMELN
ncbi:MAG: hypothetical protein HUJ99_00355, partial [Bacteroidaceae bacterium]|nr:hypothetical protein [Bacteroidaceae bacterium]